MEKLYWACETNRRDRKRRNCQNTSFPPSLKHLPLPRRGGGGREGSNRPGWKWGRGGLSSEQAATAGHGRPPGWVRPLGHRHHWINGQGSNPPQPGLSFSLEVEPGVSWLAAFPDASQLNEYIFGSQISYWRIFRYIRIKNLIRTNILAGRCWSHNDNKRSTY